MVGAGTDLQLAERGCRFGSRSALLVEHDLFRKPVSTFRDHALAPIRSLAPLGAVLLDRPLGRLRIQVAKEVGVIDGIDAVHAALDHEPTSLFALIARRQCGDTRAENKDSRQSNLCLGEHGPLSCQVLLTPPWCVCEHPVAADALCKSYGRIPPKR